MRQEEAPSDSAREALRPDTDTGGKQQHMEERQVCLMQTWSGRRPTGRLPRPPRLTAAENDLGSAVHLEPAGGTQGEQQQQQQQQQKQQQPFFCWGRSAEANDSKAQEGQGAHEVPCMYDMRAARWRASGRRHGGCMPPPPLTPPPPLPYPPPPPPPLSRPPLPHPPPPHPAAPPPGPLPSPPPLPPHSPPPPLPPPHSPLFFAILLSSPPFLLLLLFLYVCHALSAILTAA